MASAQRRDFARPAQAGATATAPRQEPDVRRKVWGSGRKRQGQRRSPRRDSRPPPAAKPSSWRSEGGRRAREQPGSQAPKVQLLKCVCVECPFNKNAYFLTKRAFSSSLNKCGSPCPRLSAVQVPHPTQVIAAHPTTEQLKPLRQFISAWKVIPGISRWLLNVIERGYTLQFRRRPPRFNGVVQSSNIASKCPGSEARDWLSARERSSRASPTTRAGERVLQPLLSWYPRGMGGFAQFWISDPSTERFAYVRSGC